ncbi:MAG: hypothetical protein FJZ75_05200 [Bacteroidetes bacterium]|nr:hypothetical protein [Bacteroidota bacterium]
MKTIFRIVHSALFVLIFVSFQSLLAQGSLQFNQVLLISTADTVPANKVWKIEALAYNGGAPFASGANNYSHLFSGNRGFEGIARFLINGSPVVLPVTYLTNNYNATSSVNPNFTFPMWLPAGSILTPQTNISYLSVLEFNLVP